MHRQAKTRGRRYGVADAFAKIIAKGGCVFASDLPGYLPEIEACIDAFGPLYEQVCGDGAGAAGEDIPCTCNATVITNTTLNDGFDPVLTMTCGGSGLVVADGVALDLAGQTITGSGAGIGIVAGSSTTTSNGTVDGFETGAVSTGNSATFTNVVLSHSSDNGLVVGSADGSSAFTITFGGTDSEVSDSGGSGIVIYPAASLVLADAAVLRNEGSGIDARGDLAATNVEVRLNAAHGVRVETDGAVTLSDCDIHDSGNHPSGGLAGQSGLYVLRTDPLEGVQVNGSTSTIHDNSGNGITLGHGTDQSGPVYGLLADSQIYGNGIGISIEQKDEIVATTSSTILSNNVYNNALSGLYMKRSFQKPLATSDRRTISANDFHHNAVSGMCTPQTGDQVAAQVVFDGPVMGTDPSVSNSPPDIGPDPVLYPADYRCYWGADDSDAVASLTACNNMNNPDDADEAGGISNHCLWNGTQCRLAWDIGGTESVGGCDSSRNRIYAYVNDPVESPATQRGVFATNGAYCRARRNTWGAGGALNGFYADNASDSRVDPDNDCGSISTCP